MLSWSSSETGQQIDLTAVAGGRPGVGLEHGVGVNQQYEPAGCRVDAGVDGVGL